MSDPLDLDPESTRAVGTSPQDAEPVTEPSAPAPAPEPAVAAPTAPAPSTEPVRHARGLRVRTLVFGLLLGLVAATALVSETTGDRVDGGAIAIVALIGAGVILLAGAMGAAARSEG